MEEFRESGHRLGLLGCPSGREAKLPLPLIQVIRLRLPELLSNDAASQAEQLAS